MSMYQLIRHGRGHRRDEADKPTIMMRAITWATAPPAQPDDAERARRDGATLARLLTPEQRSRYAETQDRAVAADFLARERAAVLAERDTLEPTGEEREALTVPWQAPEGGAWLQQTFQVMSLVIALAIPVVLLAGSVVGDAGLGIAGLLVLLIAVTFTAEALTAAALDRRRVAPLLEWATTRPGQLGRGVPGSSPGTTVTGALGCLAYAVLMAFAISIIIGLVFLGLFAVIALLAAAFGGTFSDFWEPDLILGLVTAVVAPIAVGAVLLSAWRLGALAEHRRHSALEWLVPEPEDTPGTLGS
ncbi:hypothetical protein ACQBAT_14825 [Ornithinimicrobium sp. Y1847]|uniref:hypothetical protein n=1 Tax=unclassified Ornithinimicrobium TaxID=2615080 RepID=UPI003B6787E1